MFYKKQLDTYLYIILNFKIFFLTILCIFLRWNLKVLCCKVFLGSHAEYIHHVFKLENNLLNNRDFNIDQKKIIILIMIFSITEQPY